MCKIIDEQKKEKAVVLELQGVLFGVTKRCMPKEEFQNIFPEQEIKNWECVPRNQILENPDVFSIIDSKKIGTINCNVRRLN